MADNNHEGRHHTPQTMNIVYNYVWLLLGMEDADKWGRTPVRRKLPAEEREGREREGGERGREEGRREGGREEKQRQRMNVQEKKGLEKGKDTTGKRVKSEQKGALPL